MRIMTMIQLFIIIKYRFIHILNQTPPITISRSVVGFIKWTYSISIPSSYRIANIRKIKRKIQAFRFLSRRRLKSSRLIGRSSCPSYTPDNQRYQFLTPSHRMRKVFSPGKKWLLPWWEMASSLGRNRLFPGEKENVPLTGRSICPGQGL